MQCSQRWCFALRAFSDCWKQLLPMLESPLVATEDKSTRHEEASFKAATIDRSPARKFTFSGK